MKTLPLIIGLILIGSGVYITATDAKKPHHIVKKCGVTIIQDYWTTNPFEVSQKWVYGVGPNQIGGMVPILVTNKLW